MQLDTSLKRTRSRKNQLMVESIAQLKKKEKELKELKKQLTKKADPREDFEPHTLNQGLASLATPPCESPHPLPRPISLHRHLSLGDTSQRNEDGEADAGILIRLTNTKLPHWMPQLTGE
ncbi:hypothetical protein Bca52824_019521 [Brassica carinata]|uniref:K-box domain-containing protein n=1 Tax=Brassica carinata TaxID=52824 RepID=A0A8X7VRX3_BRACI|nr:hypothetical protein Bca52824_019521 [Brassica carinata]